jgi:hypothetical protein
MQINWVIVFEFVKSVAGVAVELTKALAWPLVAMLGFLLLRRPLADLVAQIARRASKLSVYEVSVELATLPELSPPWSVGSNDVRQLNSALIFDSATQSLFAELLKPGNADYALVELGSGAEWLTSRLFVFALVLGNVTKIRAFVFVENTGSVRHQFLGVATPAEIQAAMAERYPWLAEAYVRTAAGEYGVQPAEASGVSRFRKQTPLFIAAEPWRINNFVRQFIETVQRTSPPPPDEAESHLELEAKPRRWERAHWITGERLERDLAGRLKSSWYHYSPDSSRRSVAEAVARRDGPFVAFVDQDRRFLSLIDRHALLDQIGKREASAADAQESKAP